MDKVGNGKLLACFFIWIFMVEGLLGSGFRLSGRKTTKKYLSSDSKEVEEDETIQKDSPEYAWRKFKKEHHLHYLPLTENTKRKVFYRNYELIKNHSRLQWIYNYKLTMNKFGLTDFRSNSDKRCIDESKLAQETFCKTKTLTGKDHIPDAVDWRPKHPWRVYKVGDQGSCSSCWAFSAVAVLEGWFARRHIFQEFSPQQLLDCADRAHKSCDEDSSVPIAFKILQGLNGSIATIKTYPYKGQSRPYIRDGQLCPIKDNSSTLDRNSVHTFTGRCARVTRTGSKEEQLKKAVAKYGPVSVSIHANLPTFKFYSGGIYDDTKCKGNFKPTHAVTVVGYNTNGKKDYWIIKNSWGSNWGDHGFMKMAMGHNLCGITNYAYFVMDQKDYDDHDDDPRGPKCKLGSKVGCGSFALKSANVNNSVQVICLIVLYLLYICNGFSRN